MIKLFPHTDFNFTIFILKGAARDSPDHHLERRDARATLSGPPDSATVILMLGVILWESITCLKV